MTVRTTVTVCPYRTAPYRTVQLSVQPYNRTNCHCPDQLSTVRTTTNQPATNRTTVPYRTVIDNCRSTCYRNRTTVIQLSVINRTVQQLLPSTVNCLSVSHHRRPYRTTLTVCLSVIPYRTVVPSVPSVPVRYLSDIIKLTCTVCTVPYYQTPSDRPYTDRPSVAVVNRRTVRKPYRTNRHRTVTIP